MPIALAQPTARARLTKTLHGVAALVVGSLVTCAGRPGEAAVHQLSGQCERAPATLPEAPVLKWTTLVGAGLASDVVPTSNARFVAITEDARLVQWDSHGRERWGRLLPQAATSHPLSFDARILLTTRQGALLEYSERGVSRSTLTLPLADPDEPTQLLLLDCATVAVVSGAEVLIVRGDKVRAHLRATARIVSARAQDGTEGIRFVTTAGDYVQWQGHLEPHLVRSLPSTHVSLTQAGALVTANNTLTAHYAGGGVVLLGELTGSVTLEGAPLAGRDAWFVWTKQGQLAAFVKREQQPRMWPGVSYAAGQQRPAIRIDSAGRAATMTNDGRLVTWHPVSGHTSRSAPLPCRRARSVTSLTDGTLVLACDSGQMFGFFDGPSVAP